MLSIKLFRLVFCLFWFNRNIETLCFSIEAKLKQTVLKQTKINPKKMKQNMLSITLCIETLCFGIEPKEQKLTFCFG
jgi:hypothetical protein